MKKVKPGDRFNFPANMFNGLVDLLDKRPSTGGGPVDADQDRTCCWVKNGTGEDILAFGVIGIGPVIYTYEENNFAYFNTFAFEGPKAVKANYEYKWGITQQPIKDGSIGKVRLSGISHCVINIYNASGRIQFAGPAADGNVLFLKPADCGARVLYISETSDLEDEDEEIDLRKAIIVM